MAVRPDPQAPQPVTISVRAIGHQGFFSERHRDSLDARVT
jgi:hypothetical protein